MLATATRYDAVVRAALLLVALAACGFEPGMYPDDSGSGSGSDAACAWTYTPTNFDPCMLPAPAGLTVTTDSTIDTAATTLPKRQVVQSDGTPLTVIHLSSLVVDPFVTLTLTGTGVVLAVDGEATINGTIVAAGGTDNDVHCATARGGNGTDSGDEDDGGGGGGGGAAAAGDGGSGSAGSGVLAGFAGEKGVKATSTLSPLRGGCRGGDGGRPDGRGQAALGGRGGGALQISTNTKLSLRGMIDAAGRGGRGGTAAHVGAGGGGSGGGILLEGPAIDFGLGSRICADGGSGGEGGGVTVAGRNGETGACTAILGAQTPRTPNIAGGSGGGGGFRVVHDGGNAGAAASSGGGGGGGGGVGWIRISSPNVDDSGAIITPEPI